MGKKQLILTHKEEGGERGRTLFKRRRGEGAFKISVCLKEIGEGGNRFSPFGERIYPRNNGRRREELIFNCGGKAVFFLEDWRGLP